MASRPSRRCSSSYRRLVAWHRWILTWHVLLCFLIAVVLFVPVGTVLTSDRPTVRPRALAGRGRARRARVGGVTARRSDSSTSAYPIRCAGRAHRRASLGSVAVNYGRVAASRVGGSQELSSSFSRSSSSSISSPAWSRLPPASSWSRSSSCLASPLSRCFQSSSREQGSTSSIMFGRVFPFLQFQGQDRIRSATGCFAQAGPRITRSRSAFCSR